MPKCLKVRGAKACVRVDSDVHARASEHSWHLHHGYPATTIGSGAKAQKLYLHRFVTAAKSGTIIDHQNGDPLDNRRSNLRRASSAQNSANSKRPVTNGTGLKGVSKRGSKFRAFIHKAGTTHALGSFDTAKAAACRYDREAKKLFGRFAKTNKLRCK